jgi:glucokinase
MSATILAGDIGGTKCNLGLYTVSASRELELVRQDTLVSRDFHRLEDALESFLGQPAPVIDACAVGVAGPVMEGVVTGTNLPWRVDAQSLAQSLKTDRVCLMNDLEVTAYGALFLPQEKLCVLQPGIVRRGNCAVIAAGTGLGQAYLFWDGCRHRPSATEGGHADFGPRNALESRLHAWLLTKYPRVSCERVISGPGLVEIFDFLRNAMGRPANPSVVARISVQDPGEVIGKAALAGECAACREAAELFVGLYGAQAGNLALTVMALGGVYVGGGIVTKLLPLFTQGTFMAAFRAKMPFEKLMNDMPVKIILDARTAQRGAAHAATDMLD